VITYIEASQDVTDAHPYFVFHDFDSNIHLRLTFKRMCLASFATNPNGYRVHAGAVLKCYAADKNQATPATYHISDHNFNLDISLSYGSVIGNIADIAYKRLRADQYYSMIAS